MKKPDVSIIMPSLNVAPYIKECVDSVLGQTLENIEVICVDGGSDDGTLEILQEYEKKDNRLKLFQYGVRSVGAQFNFGFSVAKADYIGVVETDDYIRKDMYERLYKVIIKEKVDYVKADFITFYTLENGERLYENVNQFAEDDYYDRVIDPRCINDLYKSNLGLWRGLYSRAFLEKKKILMNETPGAAFQDISFKLETLYSANKAYYMKDGLYYYRTDRENASQYSSKSLYYVWLEYLTLEAKRKDSSDLFEKGYFISMAMTVIYELGEVLDRCGYELDKDSSFYCWWFITRIKAAMSEGVILYDDFDEKTAQLLSLFLEDFSAYKDCVKRQHVFMTREEKIFKSEIMIFGAGLLGRKTIKYLDQKGIFKNIICIIDNSLEKRKKTVAGITIVSPQEAINKYPQALCIIANKRNWKEIEKQYISLGGKVENVLVIGKTNE